MRARNIKPSLFQNEVLAVSDPLYTVLFAGLWCLADREGRLEDRPTKIHFLINAGRSAVSTALAIDWLTAHGFIVRYRVNSSDLIEVVNFVKHQRPYVREAASVLPPPPSNKNRHLMNDAAVTDRVNPLRVETMNTAITGQGTTITGPVALIPDSGFLIPDTGSLIPDSPGASERLLDARRARPGADQTIFKIDKERIDSDGKNLPSLAVTVSTLAKRMRLNP